MIDHDMATRFANADWTENSAEEFLARAYLELKAENEKLKATMREIRSHLYQGKGSYSDMCEWVLNKTEVVRK